MKFLCVPCDSPMKLQTVAPPERGSLAVVYACPECGYEMAMLTNAYETQVVQSLGVRIGPAPLSAEGAEAAGGKCPFSAMIPVGSDSGHSGVSQKGVRPGSDPGLTPIRWTDAAEARLANVPEFVRPMARVGIEKFARDRGSAEVNDDIMDAAREFFGM